MYACTTFGVPRLGHSLDLSVRDAHAARALTNCTQSLKALAMRPMFGIVSVDSLSPGASPRCDVIIDESGELRLVLAGDWDDEERAQQLLETLNRLSEYGAPSFVDLRDFGAATSQVRAAIERLS